MKKKKSEKAIPILVWSGPWSDWVVVDRFGFGEDTALY